MMEFNMGSILTFGGYHWRILDIQGNAALIITEYMIEQHPIIIALVMPHGLTVR